MADAGRGRAPAASAAHGARVLPRGGFFDFLTEDDRNDLSRIGRVQHYPSGGWVMRQGDPSDSVAVLLQGRVKVMLDTPDGRTIVLDIFGPGEVLGEFEAFGGYQARAASVVAIEPVACSALTRQQFLDYLLEHPRASMGLVRMMIRRLGAADRRRISGTSMDAAYALARFLVELSEQAGPSGSSAVTLDLALAQHEIASLIGVSRNSVVRALATLRARGFVRHRRGRIDILDPAGLRTFGDA